MSGPAPKDPPGYPYELYDLSHDWTQYQDVAAKRPDKPTELEKLFWEEAGKCQVLPLDSSSFTRAVTPRPSLAAGRTQFTWSGPVTGAPNGDAPCIITSSSMHKADIDIPPGGAEGMIVTQGGRFGGYGFYLLKGRPVFLCNLVDLKRTRWEGADALSPGQQNARFRLHV